MRAAWGTDSLLAIDRAAPHTLRGQLEGGLREAIVQGRLCAGTVLPSTRELATRLQLSRGVVVEADEQLAAEGWIVSKRGSGARVAHRAQEALAVSEASTVGGARYRFDFRPGLPYADSFPRQAWAACLRHAALHATAAQLGYPVPQGDLGARVAAHPACMVLCSGFTQGIDLFARVAVERGLRRVAVERPGFGSLTKHLTSLGLQVQQVMVDRDGLDPRHLECLDVQAVVLAPAHQFPTGAVMSTARRAHLLTWAREHGTWVVEDDYDAEFRYEGQTLPALQGGAPERVIYVGTASKVLSPALRLSWVVAPESWAGGLATMKQRTDRGGSSIEQMALARFVEQGLLDRHLKRCRAIYRRRRARLLAALSRWDLVDEVMGTAAGLHVMVRLRDGADEQRVVAEARLAGVRVHSESGYRPDNSAARYPALVLGYGAIEECDIEAGVAALAAVVARCGTAAARDVRLNALEREDLTNAVEFEPAPPTLNKGKNCPALERG
jgi:GntR family transcriptional regulator/MocR family aminotransferase